MTKKEIVSALQKKFNNWAKLLPDVEYKSCNDHAEDYPKDNNTNELHVLELAAEESNTELDWLDEDAPNEKP